MSVDFFVKLKKWSNTIIRRY